MQGRNPLARSITLLVRRRSDTPGPIAWRQVWLPISWPWATILRSSPA